MNQPEPTGSVPKRLYLIIALASLIPVLGVGILLYSTFGGEREQTFSLVPDYLAQPETVPERVKAISDRVRRIQVSHSGIEAYDSEGQRYSISNNGTHLRRGGAIPVPAQDFAVDEVDFAALAKVLAAAHERSGGNASSATVEYADGELIWRIVVWGEGGSSELMYTLDGELRLAANAR